MPDHAPPAAGVVRVRPLRRCKRIGRAGTWTLLVASLLAGCGEPPVLEVGRVGYTETELERYSPGERALLADLTAFGLAASDRRLQEVVTPLVQRDLRSIVLQRAALEIGAAAAGLDDRELEAVYAKAPDEELTIRHLVVLSERWRPAEHRDSAESRAREALERARAGEPFQALVAEYSDEPGAADRGGLLRPGREGSWVPEFWAAARSLDVGEISDVVDTEYGFHVLRLEARDTVPFEEVRGRVLERAVGLEGAFAASAAWLDRQSHGVVVDSAAITAFPDVDADRVLVRWPEAGLEPYRASDLEAYLLTVPAGQADAFLAAEPDEAARVVKAAARNALLLEQADRLGIRATGPQRAAVEQRWLGEAESWAQAIGVRGGLSDRQVKERARAAVTSHRQEVLQARGEVERIRRLLRRLYPVVGEAGLDG